MNLPRVFVVIDGKQAIFDVHYCFTLLDIGQDGANSDAVFLADSSICKQLEAKEMNIPFTEAA